MNYQENKMEQQFKNNIIFIHKGTDTYLPFIFKNARNSNPVSNIFLISDASYEFDNLIENINIKKYMEGAEEFSKVYTHFSTNKYDFELFCIQRWFILRDFMKKNDLKRCFHADSDVLIYCNIDSEYSKFLKFDFTLSEGTCGHNSFWNSYEALDNFCSFIENIYTRNDEENYQKIIDFWEQHKANNRPGGVCDMTFFNLYKKNSLYSIGEMTQLINGSTYDHNISSNIQNNTTYKNFLGIKKIIWKNYLPYIQNKDGESVRLNTIHLQGFTKRITSEFYNRKKYLIFYFILAKIKFYLNKYLK